MACSTIFARSSSKEKMEPIALDTERSESRCLVKVSALRDPSTFSSGEIFLIVPPLIY